MHLHICQLKKGVCIYSTLAVKDGLLSILLIDIPYLEVRKSAFCRLKMESCQLVSLLRILPPKHENFQMKTSGSFHISAQNIGCGY